LTRKARRSCPALHQTICAVCCGTKRQVEIACPSDCGYLATARVHPPAAVARQRERDFRFALPLLHKLPDRAYQLLLVLQVVVRRHRGAALPPLHDSTVADAAQSLAATLETATRGIIYEHQAASLPAQRLVIDLKAALDAAAGQAGPGLERDAALALRRIEEGARKARHELGGANGSETEYLDFLDRLPGEVDEASGPGALGRRRPGGGRP
jgi:hypothetical protein